MINCCVNIDIDKIQPKRLRNEIFSLVEALPSSKFWKSDNGAISWTEWNIVMKFCIHIDIDKMYPLKLSNDIWDWLSFCRDSNSDKCETIAIWYLSSVEALPSSKFWKSENGLISWTNGEYIDRLLRKHWYYQDLAQEIVKCHFHRSRFCRAPNSEKVKMALSLELSGILWWNFAYTLVNWQDKAHEIVKWIWDWSRFCRGSNSEKSEN